MTDPRIEAVAKAIHDRDDRIAMFYSWHKESAELQEWYCNLAEAALAAADSGQEPVAFRWKHVNDAAATWHYQEQPIRNHNEYLIVEPLFASPPLPSREANRSAGGNDSSLPSGESDPASDAGLSPGRSLPSREAVAWKCKARHSSYPEPQDCDWPLCGCDPVADKVIAALEESGFSRSSHPLPNIKEIITEIDGVLADYNEFVSSEAKTWIAINILKLLGVEQPGITTDREQPITDEQIEHMVSRFLGWKLPTDFNPDGGVSFKHADDARSHPTGTCLFTHAQANEMVRYMIEGLGGVRRARTMTVAEKQIMSKRVEAVARAIHDAEYGQGAFDRALKGAPLGLLKHLADKYEDGHPDWKPLNDMFGVLSQISNAVTGLVRPASPPLPSREANRSAGGNDSSLPSGESDPASDAGLSPGRSLPSREAVMRIIYQYTDPPEANRTGNIGRCADAILDLLKDRK